MSRTVVREALRILEIEGLIEIRPGRNGGSLVRVPDAGSFSRSLDIFVRGSRVRFNDVLEARVQLEPICAQFAAERRTDADLKLLKDATIAVEAEIDDIPAFLSANMTWHVVVAQISHNQILAAFMQAMATAVRASTDVADFNSPSTLQATVRAHQRVVSAITKGDGEAARKAMLRHVGGYQDMVVKVPVPVEVELDTRSRANARRARA